MPKPPDSIVCGARPRIYLALPRGSPRALERGFRCEYLGGIFASCPGISIARVRGQRREFRATRAATRW
eukprot:2174765-Pyramimonas_sp.AAC.1